MKTENMTDLLQKYAGNQLSNDELSVLKKNINSSNDEELETYLLDLWKHETGKQIDPAITEMIKEDIDKFNGRKQWSHKLMIRKAMQWAAIIAIPLFATFMYFLFDRIPEPAASDMIVSVGSGEQVSIVLPDGTKVKLNSETTLNYNINDFNRKVREISLGGEAFFEVAHNEKIPFIIKTKHMDVKVLGTTFNLQARDEEATTELSLIEGKVSLTACTTSQNVVLYANQKAILDKRTGDIRVLKDDPEITTAWLRKELAFHATPIRKVFREIERSYGIRISIDENEILYNDLFTGTFSTDNLNETLEILKMHYRFNYTIAGKQVAIKDFRLNNKKGS
ncbi:MAG: FecR domain-containing protein [Paludibacter sp.]|nr:FecR domain-containing protein [Paludibacter sp.]